MNHRHTITRDELRQKIDRRDPFVLFEVLPEPYYRKHHLPGAVHMAPTDIEATAARVVNAKDADIVIYCWDDH